MIPGVPVYDVDFYSDEVIADTYSHYAALRALGPVVWLPRNGAFALPRYAEVASALRNHKVLVSGKGADRALAFDFVPLDPSKKMRSPEDEDTDDELAIPALADATPKKALPGPKDKGDKPKSSGAVPSVPRKKKDE